jgi:acetylornithine deacetylase
MLHAIKRIRDAGVVPPRSIVYAGCVDEEHLMRGSRQLAEQLSPSAAIIAEPTDLTVIRAHKGAVRFRVLVFGKAAHSSKPYLGINAISKMAALIGHIERAVQERLAGAVDPLLGASTLNIGVISGGQQVNFVPDQCSIDVDVRIVPGQTTAAVLDAFAAAIALAQQDDPELQAVVEPPFFSGAPLGTPETEQLVQTALQACNAVAGNAAAAGVPYGTDGCALGERGVPTIVLGPGSIDQAHGAVEWVECRQVVQAVDIYERIMLAESSAF